MLNLAGWLETARSESKVGNLRGPADQVEPNLMGKCITSLGAGRESERVIVVMKQGNACGAKGPYRRYALNKNMETDCQNDYNGNKEETSTR